MKRVVVAIDHSAVSRSLMDYAFRTRPGKGMPPSISST
jgi:hypothetical protein